MGWKWAGVLPEDYDSKKNFFDTSVVETVIVLVMKVNSSDTMVIKSTIPVGNTQQIRKKYNTKTSYSVLNSLGNLKPFTIMSTQNFQLKFRRL